MGERFQLGLAFFFEKDLDFLFGFLERFLANAGQLHAPLEGFQGFFQAGFAPLQLFHQLLQFLQSVLETRRFFGHGPEKANKVAGIINEGRPIRAAGLPHLMRQAAAVMLARMSRPIALPFFAVVLLAGSTHAAAPDGAALALACNACHGAAEMPVLAGQPPQDFLDKMRTFQAGQRAATLMPRIARAYSEEELAAMAAYFAEQRP